MSANTIRDDHDEQANQFFAETITLMDATLNVSGYLADSAANERTEAEARFERVRRLAQEYVDAHERHAAFYTPDRPDIEKDEEAYIKWEIARTRACRASIDAEGPFKKAALEYFLAPERAP